MVSVVVVFRGGGNMTAGAPRVVAAVVWDGSHIDYARSHSLRPRRYVFWLVAKDDKGLISKEKVRGQFDGSLWVSELVLGRRLCELHRHEGEALSKACALAAFAAHHCGRGGGAPVGQGGAQEARVRRPGERPGRPRGVAAAAGLETVA